MGLFDKLKRSKKTENTEKDIFDTIYNFFKKQNSYDEDDWFE